MARKSETKTIAALPQVKREVWEVGRRVLEVSVTELERRGERPEMLLAVQPGERGGVVQCDVVASGAPPAALADFALRAMRKPMIGKPRRPQAVRVSSPTEAEVLAESLAAVGVWLEVSHHLTVLDDLHEQMGQTFGGLVGDYRTQAAQAGEVLSEDGLRQVFHTAREFYRQALWDEFDDTELFEIALRPAQGAAKTLYGIVLGDMRQEYGLALYSSLEDLRRFYEFSGEHADLLMKSPQDLDKGRLDPKQWQQEGEVMAKLLSVAVLSLTYTRQKDVPPALLEEARQLKLPLANKSAFPLVMRLGGGQMKVGTARDLGDMFSALQAVLDWDKHIMEMDVEDELDVTITSNLAAVADFLPEVMARTTLRENLCVPEESDDLFPPELNDFLGALLDDQPSLKPAAKAKSAKSASGKKTPIVSKPAAPKTAAPKSPCVYTLHAYLMEGPIARANRGKEISRKIQILGRQTLHDLHEALFSAFDRWEEHLYEFNLGQGPGDRSQLYFYRGGGEASDQEAGDPEETTLDSLNLRVGRRYGYTFDMGDNWEHIIEVVSIEEGPIKGKYPRVVGKVGKAPPQYPDDDEDA